MTNLNIFGDIAGNHKNLMALIKKMPAGIPVSLGDMCDRGPNSKEVFDFFMTNGLAVLGNHEHMMLDELDFIRATLNGTEYHKYYEPGLWMMPLMSNYCWKDNGGLATIKSFGGPEIDDDGYLDTEAVLEAIPRAYIDWMRQLPLYLELDGLFISHAPKRPDWTVERACQLGDGPYRPSGKYKDMDDCLIWNRGSTRRMKDKFQVSGHNARREPEWLEDKKGIYGINLDTSRADFLTGMHWPTRELFEQEYID